MPINHYGSPVTAELTTGTVVLHGEATGTGVGVPHHRSENTSTVDILIIKYQLSSSNIINHHYPSLFTINYHQGITSHQPSSTIARVALPPRTGVSGWLRWWPWAIWINVDTRSRLLRCTWIQINRSDEVCGHPGRVGARHEG